MTAPEQPVAGALTEDERHALGCSCWHIDGVWQHVRFCPVPTVERILAARSQPPAERAGGEAVAAVPVRPYAPGTPLVAVSEAAWEDAQTAETQVPELQDALANANAYAARMPEKIADHLLTHVGGDESDQWQAGHNYAIREAARLVRERYFALDEGEPAAALSTGTAARDEAVVKAEACTLTQGPLNDVREVEDYWWVRPNGKGSLGYNRPEILRRCQRIWGGRIEVIRQTVTTVTTVYDETPAALSEQPTPEGGEDRG